MGKRKERRHAAQSAAGRRVKLDLWTDEIVVRSEPTGAVASTSLHDESGGAVDQNHGAGSSSSPSSSGGFTGLLNGGLCKEELPTGRLFHGKTQKYWFNKYYLA